jgi:large subunit ribosomal protein L21
MQALVEIAGQQFDVKAKDVVRVPHLQGNIGEVIEFKKLFLANNGNETLVGTPTISGKVTAQILEHGKDKKVLVFKKKRRKGYKKLNGHRQQFTKIAITGVSVDNLGTEEFEISDIIVKATEDEVLDTKEEKVVFDDTVIDDEKVEDTPTEEIADDNESDEEEITEAANDKLVFDDTENLEDNPAEDQENKENK